MTLLYQIAASYNPEMTCGEDFCELVKTCDNYPAFWNHTFSLKFANTTSLYVYVPLSTFAFDSDHGTCTIMIQELDAIQNPQSDSQVMLGTMFLQQFITEFTYNYTDQTSLMKFGVSDAYAMTGVYLNEAYTNKAVNQGAAFPAMPDFSQVIPIYSNKEMDVWV